MVEVIPSLLTNNPNEITQKLALIEGICERVHIDIIDGKFISNSTIDPTILADIETPILIDYHLMTDEPTNWIEKCVRGMGDRIIGHIEHMNDQIEFISQVTSRGLKVGLAIDLESPVEAINKEIINDVDLILVMSVQAGFGGQSFHDEIFAKIEELNKIRSHDSTPFRIGVDGGITSENAKELIKLRVDELIIGKRLFEGEIEENIEKYSTL